MTGDGTVFAPRLAGATEVTGVGEEGGPGMTPMGGMGGMGGAGSGFGRVERQRLSYLPEEAPYWGTEPGVASLGSPAADDDSFAEEDFDAVPRRIAGIGARSESEQAQNAMTDWGTP